MVSSPHPLPTPITALHARTVASTVDMRSPATQVRRLPLLMDM